MTLRVKRKKPHRAGPPNAATQLTENPHSRRLAASVKRIICFTALAGWMPYSAATRLLKLLRLEAA